MITEKKFQLVYNWIFIPVWNECQNGYFKKQVEINRGWVWLLILIFYECKQQQSTSQIRSVKVFMKPSDEQISFDLTYIIEISFCLIITEGVTNWQILGTFILDLEWNLYQMYHISTYSVRNHVKLRGFSKDTLLFGGFWLWAWRISWGLQTCIAERSKVPNG